MGANDNTCDFSIRRASEEDVPVIRRVADVAFRETYREILTEEQIDYMMEWMYSEDSIRRQMAVEGHVFFLVERFPDGEMGADGDVRHLQPFPCGYASVHKDWSSGDEEGREVWHLEKIYLLPSCHGSGIGRELFLHVAGFVRGLCQGPCRLELNVNRYNKARGFYERMGMSIIRQGDFHIGNGYYMNDYIMGMDI